MENLVQMTVTDAIARVVLNRPDVGNAINLALARELVAAATRCNEDADIRCIILTGAGRLFCTGGDIGTFVSAGHAAPQVLAELADTVHEALLLFSTMKKPVVVAVNGPSAGAGLGIALCGDFLICARSAHFSAGYSTIGLTPDAGATWILPRLIGLRKTQEMLLSNRRVSSDEALSIGLVTRVVDDAELTTETAKLATTLTKSAAAAIGAIKTLLMAGYSSTLEEQLHRESISIAAAGGGSESREGTLAFVEKRRPDFLAITPPVA